MRSNGKGKSDSPDFNIRPSKSYLDSLADFAGLLGSIDSAQKAADEMMSGSNNGAMNFRNENNSNAQNGQNAEAETKAEEPAPEPTLEELLGQLDSLVGLEKIKANVHSLMNLVKVRRLREENGLAVPPISLHLVFMGNPGTGKTTVARLVAKLYHAIGVLSKGQLVEVDRSGLVAGYVGQTAIKTSEAIKKAMGGVLFIDEAYSLVSKDGANDFGHEAVETILKAMEDNRNDFVVIVAGYEGLMEQFISSNPGLESRFNRYFIFEDYNGGELFEIFNDLCGKNQYILDGGAEEYAKENFNYMYETRDENFGNGRDVRNLFENVVAVQSDRVSAMESPTKENLMTVLREDIEKASVM